MKTKKLNLQGLTTEQEFTLACEMLSRCIGTIKCGCEHSFIDKESLKRLCKEFSEL